mmetsp:Transcript_81939/g.162752  ORF Transcript_81939/g.162752 Transcript_81939/m.162752 type:complete len:398 (+) Transcript_81939:58-1251(+)|eukprot:CAMPEP_0172869058 /NCGR_PEP_ID=MMETSP1075-20121228/87932_1 /TAXON_ID=2916 /ORGANISM="Ceratium fusus, Strain PA161109" /LENGTH=397 /DNA_ID=CAMNT_0013718863 /DNA_START=56 /DNA_END=1249 /DNA_ORIENTATION=+
MTRDVTEFSNALSSVYKRHSVLEPQLQQQELRNLSERERKMLHRAEQRLQQQLQTAQAAFLQEFRNHSVVVRREVDKIREQLRIKFEEDYKTQIQCLHQQLEEERAQREKHKAEISKLKCAAIAQDAYTRAHRLGLDKKEELRSRIQELEEEMAVVKKEGAELARQLSRRNDLVAQLDADVSGLREELRKQVANSAHERQSWEGLINGLRQEMSQQQEHFGIHLREYETKFEEYRAKTAAELQIQEILNARRSAALVDMEEERLRHIKAKEKPTQRVVATDVPPEMDTALGEPDPDSEQALQNSTAEAPYDIMNVSRYRVDDMGMDTSWRDYQPRTSFLGPQDRKTLFPKFQVERTPNTSRSLRLPSMSEDQIGHQPRVQPRNPLAVSTVLGPRTSI